MELVERDGVAIWWYNRLSLPEVDLDSFGSDWIDRVRSEYDAVGRDVWAIDLTTDIGIPVFVAASRRRSPDPEDLIFGFGAHLGWPKWRSWQVALGLYVVAGITELVQLWVPGRVSSIWHVALDVGGGLTGFLMAWLVIYAWGNESIGEDAQSAVR